MRLFGLVHLSGFVRLSTLVVATSCTLLSCAEAFAAEFTMHFKETKQTTVKAGTMTGPGSKPLAADETKTESIPVEVVLGDNYFWVLKPDNRVLYDFAKRRIYTLNDKTKTYTDNSLYSVIAFRSSEFQNRIMISGLLSTVNAAQDMATDKPTLESIFAVEQNSMKLTDVKPVVDRATTGDTTVFKVGGKPLVTFKASTETIPKEFAKSWSHFLIYDMQLHPEVRRAIAESGKVPQKLSFVIPEMVETRKVELDLIPESTEPTATRVSSVLSVPPTFTLTPDHFLSDLKAAPVANIPKSRADVEAFSKAALAEGNPTDATLAWFEWQIMTGDTNIPPEIVQAMKTKSATDKNLNNLMRGFTGEDPQAQLDALTQLDAVPLKKKYLLDVYKGNLLSGPLQKPGGIDALKRAINANPDLLGARLDLGDLYYGSYQMPTAFALWDGVEAKSPTHPMLAKVKDLREHLEHAFPDYF